MSMRASCRLLFFFACSQTGEGIDAWFTEDHNNGFQLGLAE